jgi:hypothetical protein
MLPLPNGQKLDLTRLRTGRTVERNDQTRAMLGNLTYYSFIGQNDITASHLERTSIDLRDRILKGYNQRWAYVTVAAIITEGWTHPSRTEEETAAMMEEFIRLLVPELKRPDGAALL